MATLTPLSKEDKILIKSLQEWLQRLAVYNKVFEQRLDEKQAAGEVWNSRQASGQRQTQSAY